MISTLKVKPEKDWFGYALTLIGGAILSFAITWFQSSSTQRDAVNAEVERVRAVKQSMVSIIEELVLNSKVIDLDRITRLVDQRRREERITTPISASEVVELADFSIANSRHLGIDAKEKIKPLFENFYKEVNARVFKPSNDGNLSSSPFLNEVAKKIQDGKATEALAALTRLEEAHRVELAEAQKRAAPGLIEGLLDIISNPDKRAMFGSIFSAYAVVMAMFIFLKTRTKRRDEQSPL